jgi:glyoxylase-like metal-dependent hydrolase (beta-lactamase superfamily II)
MARCSSETVESAGHTAGHTVFLIIAEELMKVK